MSETQQPAKRFAEWREQHVHWGMLRTLGNSRLVTSSIAWLFIVPIAAKLLAPFAGQHTLDLSWFDPGLDEPITVTIALPFSWKRFYLMSWLFVIGQAVYWLACPEIVRKYQSFGAYSADHPGLGKLIDFITTAAMRRRLPTLQRLNEFSTSHGGKLLEQPLTRRDSRVQLCYDLAIFRKSGEEPLRTQAANDTFDAVLNAEQHSYVSAFVVSGLFFAGGLFLFLWVLVEGVSEVCKLL